jgi:1-acyl-sn-glycerol-3-phosphate acyltransferase
MGKENVPKSGSLLVVSNHLSVSDPILIGVYLGRKISFMAKEELFKNRLIGYFLKYLGAFPVYRGSSSRDALYKAEKILKEEKALGMFPEGKRSMQNALQSGMNGTALLIYHNPVPIIPVGFTGTENIRGVSWIWSRPKVTITFGTPFYLPNKKERLSKDILEQNSNIIMEHIAEILPRKYQGQYAKQES